MARVGPHRHKKKFTEYFNIIQKKNSAFNGLSTLQMNIVTLQTGRSSDVGFYVLTAVVIKKI